MLASVQPGTSVLDFSFSVPDLTQARAMGYRAVIGYLPWNPDVNESGCLNHALVARLLGLGFGWSGVWEADSAAALQAGTGRPRNPGLGYPDGKTACASAAGLGAYPGSVVYWAVDWDADPVTVGGYGINFARACSEAGYVPGVYGSRRVVDYIVGQGIAKAGWQAEAWSHGTISQFASLIQRANYKPIAGTDHNDTILPTVYTVHPDVDLVTSTWASPGDDFLTTPEDKALLVKAAAAGSPYDVSVYAAPDNRWLTNAANAPPPAGGVPLAGLERVPAMVGWMLETVTTVRAMWDRVTDLQADVDAVKAGGPTSVGAVDPAALVDAMFARAKARL